MPGPEIHIDRIRLHVRGVSPEVARSAVASLGPALHEALTPRLADRNASAVAPIAHVQSPTMQISANADSTTLRQALAAQLATTIANQISTPASKSKSVR